MSTVVLTPAEVARERTRDLLRAVHLGAPAVLVDSPPGAGKTTVGGKIAATAWGVHRENVMVSCWTNRQAIDFAVRLARNYSKVPVQLFIKEDVAVLVPEDARLLRNLTLVHKTKELEPEGVAVSNNTKWVAYELPHRYKWLLVDEAYQLADVGFQQLAPLADRYVLIGDPGQIPPLVRADISPWGSDPAGPHVPAPAAFLARHPGVPRADLPISWRLPRDSAALVQDAFYDFPFGSGDPEGQRRLELDAGSSSKADAALDQLVGPDASLAAAVLGDEEVATDVDPEMASFEAEAAKRLLDRRGRYVDEHSGEWRPIEPKDIGIVAAHRVQVAEIEKELRARGVVTGSSGVVTETPERWQGLERQVMIVHHPLAGIADLSPFDLDRGRLCVMLSRHRIACLLVGRATISEALDMHAHRGERFPGRPDEEYLGWRAHQVIWQHLIGGDIGVEV